MPTLTGLVRRAEIVGEDGGSLTGSSLAIKVFVDENWQPELHLVAPW